MAILTGKQRKNLDKSEFGLPDERKFPLTDKTHVQKAIQFFKYCPPDKKKQLASAINRKAKSLGMKINAKGEFAKYISKDVATNETMYSIMDASNIGTMSPIVGGTATLTKTVGPKVLLDAEDKTVMDALTGKLFNIDIEEHDEGFPTIEVQIISEDPTHYTTRTPYFGASYTLDQSRKQVTSDVVADFAKKIIYHNEFVDAMQYMTSEFDDRERVRNLRKEIINTVMHSAVTVNDKVPLLANLIKQAVHNDEAKYHIATIYMMDKELAAKVVKKYLTDERNESGFAYIRSLNKWEDITRLPHAVDRLFNLHEAKMEEGCPPFIVQDLHNIARLYEDYIDIEDAAIEYGRSKGLREATMIKDNIILQQLHMMKKHLTKYELDWYLCIREEFNNPTYAKHFPYMNIFAGFQGTRGIYRLIPMIKDTNQLVYIRYCIGHFEDDHSVKLHLDDLLITTRMKREDIGKHILFVELNPPIHHSVTTESRVFSKFSNRILDALKGIRVSKEGDIKLNLQNKLTFEHYEEIHAIIKENEKQKNYEAMKENLAYIFALIGTIEKIYMNEHGKKYMPDDSEYQEMIRLRALLISDFKVYLRVVMKHDRKFDFLKYYNESEVNRSVFVVHGKDVQYMARLLRTIMIN